MPQRRPRTAMMALDAASIRRIMETPPAMMTYQGARTGRFYRTGADQIFNFCYGYVARRSPWPVRPVAVIATSHDVRLLFRERRCFIREAFYVAPDSVSADLMTDWGAWIVSDPFVMNEVSPLQAARRVAAEYHVPYVVRVKDL